MSCGADIVRKYDPTIEGMTAALADTFENQTDKDEFLSVFQLGLEDAVRRDTTEAGTQIDALQMARHLGFIAGQFEKRGINQ